MNPANGAVNELLPDFAGLPANLIPQYGSHWQICVMYGPHGAPDYFTQQDMDVFFATDWKVHYNSSRTGVRLIGPKPQWARRDGGEAGLRHPTFMTMLMPSVQLILQETCRLFWDRMVQVWVASAVRSQSCRPSCGRWQLKPGDTIQFIAIDCAQAVALESARTASLSELRYIAPEKNLPDQSVKIRIETADVFSIRWLTGDVCPPGW